MSIELTTAEQSVRDQIAGTLAPPILTALPAVDATKAGQTFCLNGTLWTYAREGQFGTLVEGTPWPVKGYKEFNAKINYLGGNTFNQLVIFNNDGFPPPTVSGSIIFFVLNFNNFWTFAPFIIATSGYDIATESSVELNVPTADAGTIDFLAVGAEESIDFNIQIKLYPPTN